MKNKIGKILMIGMVIARMIIFAAPIEAAGLTTQDLSSLNIPVRFQYNIDTEGLEEGNAVPLEITQDVYLNEQLVFRQGGAGFAVIDELKRARMLGRGGKIRITQGQLVDVNGKSHSIYLSANSKGSYKLSSPAGVLMGGSAAFNIAEAGLSSGTATGALFGIGATLIPIAFLLKKGNEAKLSRGKIMFAKVTN